MSVDLFMWVTGGLAVFAGGAYAYAFLIQRAVSAIDAYPRDAARADREELQRQYRADLDALRRDAAVTARELNDFKVRATAEFATVGYLRDVETRTLERLKHIDEKLDRLIERAMNH